MPTLNDNILPASTGLNLGAVNQTWDAFLGNVTIKKMLGALQGSIFFADQYASIQAALTAAGNNSVVVIPSTYIGTDTYVNSTNSIVIDLRSSALKIQNIGDLIPGSLVTCFGDSITAGVGASAPAFDYVSLLGNATAWNVTNGGVSGSGIADAGQIDTIYATVIAVNKNYTLLTGVNDMRNIGTNAAQQTIYRNALQAALTWMAIPDANKIKGQNTTAIAYTGAWAPTVSYGGALSQQSAALGATATVSVYGTTVYIGTIAQVSNTSTFSITIDGTSYGTFTTASTLTTLQGRTYQPAVIRISGLTELSHTVVITTTTGTAANNPAYVSWVAGNSGMYSRTGPNVYVGNCIRFTSTGYSSFGGSDTAVAQFNQIIQEVVDDLSADGLNVVLVDASGYYNPLTSGTVDGVHPGNAGHAVLAAAFQQEISGVITPRDRQAAKRQNPVYYTYVQGSPFIRCSPGSFASVVDLTGVAADISAKDFLFFNNGFMGVMFTGNDTYLRANTTTGTVHLGDGAGVDYATFGPSSTAIFKKVTSAYGVNTVGVGFPAQYATVDLVTQAASIGGTLLYAVPAAGAGMYRINYVAKVTQAASSTSSINFSISYFDKDDNTNPLLAGTAQAGNTTTSVCQGSFIVSAKASTNINYTTTYASSGGTVMQYNLHVRLEYLG